MIVNGQYQPILPWGHKTAPGDNTSVRRKGGEIVLNAGKGDDQINIRQVAPGMYGVNINGNEHLFNRAEMERLTVKGGKGHDTIRIDPSVDVPIRVEGNRGNDRIFNGANNARIDGGRGDDQIFNRSSGTTINGGKGSDTIRSTGNFNNIDGGKGNFDDIYSQGWANRVTGGRGFDPNVVNAPGWMNTCHSMGGWNNLGNMAYNAGFQAGFNVGSAQGYDRGFADGAFWGSADRLANPWGLSASFNFTLRA